MSESYHVRVDKEYFVFSAAHFITFDGNVCERLHGHNYRVYAEVFGPLDENAYVIDFIALRDTLKSLVDALDHRVLLPTDHSQIRVVASDIEVEATYEERRWVFPREDVVLLPVINTTAELIAKYLGTRLLTELRRDTAAEIQRLVVGVDECLGQWGVWDYRA